MSGVSGKGRKPPLLGGESESKKAQPDLLNEVWVRMGCGLEMISMPNQRFETPLVHANYTRGHSPRGETFYLLNKKKSLHQKGVIEKPEGWVVFANADLLIGLNLFTGSEKR